MRRIGNFVFLFLLATAILSPPASAGTAEARVAEAATVLEQIMEIPESGIPPALLADAYGIVIVPQVIKVGFILGGRYGKGVLLARQDDGSWSPPVFVELTGGSLGWQIGAQSTDVILVFKTRRSVEGIMAGKFTLGVDAAVAAGPVGRQVSGATDVQLKAEIFSYSRSRGFFAGVSLEGSAMQIDRGALEDFYGRPDIAAREVLAGQVATDSPEVQRLRRLLERVARPPESP